MKNIGLAVLILLALAGCGGGDDGDPADATTQPVSCSDAPKNCF